MSLRNIASALASASLFVATASLFVATAFAADQVKIDSGAIEGFASPDAQIRIFEGIPYAAPPVGRLRWQPPQPVPAWEGVRQATSFGNRCMQAPIFGDMIFHDGGPSEDCLNLNVWTPAKDSGAKLPVMVWIYGGGFQAGAVSEARQDGANLAHKGVVVVSMNYRLGIFGFFSHPELTKESEHHASGNYGLLDQAAAIAWVHKNIAAFGGDPDNVTIFGESAGSFSVSAQMASPLSKDLIHRAIGESGAFFGNTLRAKNLKDSEQSGVAFAQSIHADSLEALRAVPAQQLLDDSLKQKADGFAFAPNIDGYFLPETPEKIYESGKQAHVALLAGWNHDEGNYKGFFGKDAPTKANYVKVVRSRFGRNAGKILKLFPAATDEQAQKSAGLLATADFIASGTWKWIELQLKTGGEPVYRYEFDQNLPGRNPSAYHSSEIEYVFGNLKSKALPFRPEDDKLSEQMQSYWSNFAKTGDPNGSDLPKWPQYTKEDGYQVLHFSAAPQAEPDGQRAQYQFLDKITGRSK